MGLFGSIIGSVADGVRDSSDSKFIGELRPKMMNSAIANDFETWFRDQLNSNDFLYHQYNYYDNCERIVAVNDDCVIICFDLEGTNVSEKVICNFATTLGYKPLSANGLTYSNGKLASERVLIKTFAEVVRERIENVLNEIRGDYIFGSIQYDDGTDKSGSYLDQISQRANAWAFGGNAKLDQMAGFSYSVPRQEQKSAF